MLPDPRDTLICTLQPGATVLQVPLFARLDDYVGAWAIEPKAGAALWQHARSIDLQAHIVSARDSSDPDRRRSQTELTTVKGKQLAIIRITGTLMKASSSMGDSSSTVQLRRDVREAAANPDVAAILLAIDSPGGSVAGTHDLATDIKAASKKKPVFAQVEDLGASAAYWLASQADKVFANSPTALVGSIGTLMVLYDLAGNAEQEGIKALVFATGALKGAGTPGAPITEEQANYFQGIVNESQATFDRDVRLGRGLTATQLAEVRSGAVYPAEQAQANGLIDGIQSMDRTLDALVAEVRTRQQAVKAELPPHTVTAGRAPAIPTGARNMKFEAWAASLGIILDALTDRECVDLRARYRAEQVALPIAVPVAEPAGAQQRQAQAAETARVNDITRLCRENQLPTIEVNGQRLDLAAHAIGTGMGMDQVRMAVELYQVQASRVQGPGLISRSHDRDCSKQALAAGLLLRSGGKLDHPSYRSSQAYAMKLPAWMQAGINTDARQQAMEWGHRFAHLSAIDIAREALRLDGRDVPLEREEMLKAAFSGGALTDIFTDSINAHIIATYMEAEDTTKDWTQETDVADFKPNKDIRLKKGGSLSKLPRGSTAQHGDRTDVQETFQVARYAEQIVVDEQDFIDDALNALSDLPVEMANAAARLRPDLVYAILLANPSLDATSLPIFSASNETNNLLTGSALAAATFRAMIAQMSKVQENSVNLNFQLTHILVPPDIIDLGYELAKSPYIMIAGTAGSVTERGQMNSIARHLVTPVSDARLSNGVVDPNTGTTYSGSTSTWYGACAKARTIKVAYLRGSGRAPRTRSFILDKGTWGMGWDVKHDIGAKAMDWRGFSKATA